MQIKKILKYLIFNVVTRRLIKNYCIIQLFLIFLIKLKHLLILFKLTNIQVKNIYIFSYTVLKTKKNYMYSKKYDF